MSIFSYNKISTYIALFSFYFLVFFFNPSSVQAEYGSLSFEFEVNPKQLVVGDRAEVSVKVFTKDRKPMTKDFTYSFGIKNPKPGQDCQTTDKTLLDDGVIKGYCEAKGDPGNMEIYVKSESGSNVSIDGIEYNSSIWTTYNAMFNDPKTSCQGGAIAPSALTLIKQNDLTVKVEWQQAETYVGTYEVLYGTDSTALTNKRQTQQKSLIIDNLDPAKEYYFKVQANSACKWTASSGLFKYSPRTGTVALTTEKKTATASASPKLKASPAASPTINPSPVAPLEIKVNSPQPTTNSVAQPTPSQTLPNRVWKSVSSFLKNLWPF